MAAIKQIARASASETRRKIAGKSGGNAPVACVVNRAPADRLGRRFYTAKEFAGELTEAGLPVSERSIVGRCHLPAGHPLRIASNPNFGRIYIPAAELSRLLGKAAAA